MVSESGFILSLDYVYFLDQPSFSALSGPTETENMDLIKDLFYLFDKIQRTGSHSGVQRQEVTSGCVCFFFLLMPLDLEGHSSQKVFTQLSL